MFRDLITYGHVADWMAQQIDGKGRLSQLDAVAEIRTRFGEAFLYSNANGNPAISRYVLKLFRARTEKTVVWDASRKLWRRRRAGWDRPGSRFARL
jgi:hypothetical protein